MVEGNAVTWGYLISVLQGILADKLAPKQPSAASEWIDFEVFGGADKEPSPN